LTELERIIVAWRAGGVAVAVSGGVDSLTLATLVQRVLGQAASMHHATSPAVPKEATARVRAQADRQGWTLDVFDAGEFADPAYRANPVNRCFYCKTHLYGAIARRTARQIVSGTNLDDLGEYRPGLAAARAHGVRHPFVDAGIDKIGVRRIAAELGLGEISALPAAPCLSSRIETGLRIEGNVLAMVHGIEQLVGQQLQPRVVRCRVRARGLVVELDEATLARLSPERRGVLAASLGALAGSAPVSFAPYRTGSAFIGVEG
jgi:uncharacterized protein